MSYKEEVILLFDHPKYVYEKGDVYSYVGYAGNVSISEYVHLYITTTIDKHNPLHSKIEKIRFSAIGSVFLIAATEKFCSVVEDLTFNDALKHCEYNNNLFCALEIPIQKTYLTNFIIQAFYSIIEALPIKADLVC